MRYGDALPLEIAAQDNSTSVVAVTICMTSIATVFIVLRIYGCIFILRRPLYFEEWLSVINQVCLIPQVVATDWFPQPDPPVTRQYVSIYSIARCSCHLTDFPSCSD